MYRLLIVDDEPFIVDGLYDLFLEEKRLNLDVYKAYSARKAIEWLDRTRIDIVLTDIQMPGMNGLQLLKEIHERWPLCKVVFLTAYSEFDYAYTAMQYNAASYVLKTEGEQAVVRAVEKCVEEIEKSINLKELIHKAEEQMHLTMPLLQREYLMDLLQGEKSTFQDRKEQFEKLHIPLNPGQSVLLLAGRIDNFRSAASSLEKAKRLSEIEAVYKNYMGRSIISTYINWDRDKLLWFIQPDLLSENRNDTLIWTNTMHFIKGTLEIVQGVCKKSLGISISFILDNKPTAWDELTERFCFLKQIVSYRIGYETEMLLVDSSFFDNELMRPSGSGNDMHKVYLFKAKLDILRTYLESGQSKEFFKLLTEVISFILNEDSDNDYFKIEMYQSISLMFLSHINHWNLKEKVESQINLSNLFGTADFITYKEMIEYFYKLGETIFSYQKSEQVKRMEILIANINKYINDHLNEDLSLIALSEKVFLNPAYLSRIYKQETGMNISEYICHMRINKAKELLRQSDFKIHEVASAVGFESAAYFTRVFKQLTNLTPQEYRDSVMKNK